jgi:parvulin-like peptidyl-prolyl isomerase
MPEPHVPSTEANPLPAAAAGLNPAAMGLLARFGLLRQLLRQIQVHNALVQETLSDEERQQALVAFAQEHGLANMDELEQFRRAQMLPQDAFVALVEQPARLRKHCERLYKPKAEARFLDRKTDLDRVVYSLIRLGDEGMARELFLRLDEGEASFADLAAQYSEGPERSTRGVVGPVSLTQAHPLLVERLRTAPVGVVQEPFPIEQWWLVFRVESLTPATFNEAMADRMSEELFEVWLEAEVESQFTALRPLVLADPAGQA